MTDSPTLKAVSEPAKGYNDLKYFFSNLNTLFSVRSTLAIDMMTAMPYGGLARRLADISSVTKRIYAETTAPTVGRLLDQVEESAQGNPDAWEEWDKKNLEEMRRIYDHLSSLTPEIYLASVQVANEGRRKHKEALESGNWEEASPYIQQVVDLYRKIAELKQKKFNTKTPYKALLLGYASDISQTQMDSLYDNLLEPLKDIHSRAIEKQKDMNPLPLDGGSRHEDRMWLNKSILEMMGFDFNRGGLFITNLSPTSGGTPDDVRILVRGGENATFLDSIEDTLYQGARGLYIQNLPEEWKTQPIGQTQGSLMMNALSNLYSTIIGRTPEFLELVSIRAEAAFKKVNNKSFSAENLCNLKKVINNTLCRNNADELTKILHDILRYRIEKDLIEGTLKVQDLPERWNEESKALFGKTPRTKEEGVLQNPDWFTGRFGFIPSNTLSHIIAAQLYEEIGSNDLATVGEWLNRNIHSIGRKQGTLETIRQCTGKELSEEQLLSHLQSRYL